MESHKKNFSISESFAFAWDTLVPNFKKIIGFSALVFVIQVVFNIVAKKIVPENSTNLLNKNIVIYLGNFLSIALTLGLIAVLLKIVRKQELTIKVLFQYFNKKMIDLFLVRIILWTSSLLFFSLLSAAIVPIDQVIKNSQEFLLGKTSLIEIINQIAMKKETMLSAEGMKLAAVVSILFYTYLSARVVLASLLILDKDKGAISAIKESFQLTSQFKVQGKIFLSWALFAFFGMFIAIFTLGTGMILFLPMLYLFYIAIYEKFTQ